MVLLDVTERRSLEAELRRLAHLDPLTEVYNRRRFMELAAGEFAVPPAGGGDLALLMLDIDEFKGMNDRYGHGVGDEVIRAVAQACAGVVGPGDAVARMGGEEFAILLPNASASQAADLGLRLLRAVNDTPLRVGTLTIPVGISVGGTCRVPADPHMDAVLTRADRALYAAKRAGRARLVFDVRA